MASVIFDFDSTLIPGESLEELCQAVPGLKAPERAQIEQITAAGMEGVLSFEDSLRQRLALARPTRANAIELGQRLATALTVGAARLVRRLEHEGHEVWIVSGGFREILLEVGQALAIPPERIHGVQCRWDEQGDLVDVDPANGFQISKVVGMERLAVRPALPCVGVGDGATDLALRAAGYTQVFVAYTEHAHRAKVVAQAEFVAANMEALGEILGTLLP